MQKATIVKISSILQSQILPELRIGLENHLFPQWKQQKTLSFSNENLLRNEKLRKFFDEGLLQARKTFPFW